MDYIQVGPNRRIGAPHTTHNIRVNIVKCRFSSKYMPWTSPLSAFAGCFWPSHLSWLPFRVYVGSFFNPVSFNWGKKKKKWSKLELGWFNVFTHAFYITIHICNDICNNAFHMEPTFMKGLVSNQY